MMNNRIIGKPILRADALAKVTGAALFIDDLRFPRMLYLKALRAGVPHARITHMDIQKAESIPGVIKVITGQSEVIDSEFLFGVCIIDQPPIAIEKVRHPGEIVAVVIAETEGIALNALKEIKVKYKEFPFVLDPYEASQPDAPLIHERNGFYEHLETYVPVANSNIFFKYHLKKGDYDDVFRDADLTVEENYEYPLMNHAALEPHGAIAHWDQLGELHIWSSTQSPFILREVLSKMFKLSMNKIHINVPQIGGGFGGKSDYTIEPLIAVAARAVPGYYLKWVLTREEVFVGSLLGRGMKGRMKIGSKFDGTFVGLEAELYFADGAYGDTSCNVVLAAGHNCAGPYFYPNCSLKSFGVYTNTPPVGAYRGYGHPEGQFMIERLIEKLSQKLHISSKILREKNFLKPGDKNSLGQIITEQNGNIRECFKKMYKALIATPLQKEDDKFLYGRGLVGLVKSPVQATNASSCVFLKINEDLTVNISTGGIEIGQGILTVLAQIAAETLNFPYENIRINHEVNTQLTPYEWQTVASMSTMRIGNAIILACQRAIKQFKKNASLVLDCHPDELSYNGIAIKHDDSEIPLRQLVMGYQYPDGHTVGDPILTTGTSVVRDVTLPNSETGQYQPYEWTFGSQGVDLRIEKATGEIKILHFVTSLDVGKVINPETAKGQIYGGVVQGLGAALKEEILFDENGKIKTTNFHRYKIPRLSDMPEKFTCIFLENPQRDGPFGARPMAEHPIIGTPPAVLNAIENATGISFNSIPVTPKMILQALQNKERVSRKEYVRNASEEVVDLTYYRS